MIKLAKGDGIFMSAKEIVNDFVNDPDVISVFHNDTWKEETAELRGRDEKTEEIARTMLKKKCDIKFIKEVTKLTTSQIKALM